MLPRLKVPEMPQLTQRSGPERRARSVRGAERSGAEPSGPERQTPCPACPMRPALAREAIELSRAARRRRRRSSVGAVWSRGGPGHRHGSLPRAYPKDHAEEVAAGQGRGYRCSRSDAVQLARAVPGRGLRAPSCTELHHRFRDRRWSSLARAAPVRGGRGAGALRRAGSRRPRSPGSPSSRAR